MNILDHSFSRLHIIKPGLAMTIVDRLTHQEFHLTLRHLPEERPSGLARRLAVVLYERDASVVRHEVFGNLAAHSETMSALNREFGQVDWPVTWVQGAIGASQDISGMHIFAVSGTQVHTLDMDGKPVGRVFEDADAHHCLLGNVTPVDPSQSKSDQCRQMFERLESVLETAGMRVNNIVRTWFFLDDICDWYWQFNLVRNEFYQKKELFHTLIPASTGIGGKNPSGTAVMAAGWAIRKKSDNFDIADVPSPLQCASTDYGSAFSRAVLMTAPDNRRLLISGTASIDSNGRSVHEGNVRSQIALTMEVVGKILSSIGLIFCDVTRATAYFKNPEDISIFGEWRRKRGLDLPVLTTPADICRKELLFEIELDAMLVG